MSYNRNFRHTVSQPGRYNNSGQFVSAGELGQSNLATPTRSTRSSAAVAVVTTDYTSMYPAGSNPPPQPPTPHAAPTRQYEPTPPQIQPQQPPPPQQAPQTFAAAEVVETKQEKMDVEGSEAGDGERRHSWMKGKGIKKISNKERRRRQNEHLRRLLTPKNALMVLNEMMPGEQLNNNFTVEAAPASTPYFRQDPTHKFCAGLSVEGNVYKGFGDNKLTARNQAAEQAIRDLVIKRMTKAITATPATAAAAADQNGDAATAAAAAAGEEETEPLPMIQLASYALHKLFSEWQYEGFQVPLLQLQRTNATTTDAEALSSATPKQQKVKELPADAATMHPCMLLTIMRQGLVYHELGSEGDRPQNMLFTMGVTVDGNTYIGKASNKKEARKQAARSACQAIFNVQFADPVATVAR